MFAGIEPDAGLGTHQLGKPVASDRHAKLQRLPNINRSFRVLMRAIQCPLGLRTLGRGAAEANVSDPFGS